MLLMIDNYDSFTYNLVQYLGELGEEVVVKRNDEIDLTEVKSLAPTKIMISPGPGKPDDAGLSMQLIMEMGGVVPIFGVCLGYQCIGQVFGGTIVHASEIMHGKVSDIYHKSRGVFADLAKPFRATRYHSLVVDKAGMPDCFEITAWTQNQDGSVDEIMGIRHKDLAIEGVQFHPESIRSQHGHDLIQNFLLNS